MGRYSSFSQTARNVCKGATMSPLFYFVMDIPYLIVLTLLFCSGNLIVFYETFARQRGWSVGTLFSFKRNPWFSIFGFILLILSILLSVLNTPWWDVFLIAPSGFILSFIVSSIFKTNTQILSIFLAIFSLILFFIL